jgi:hypothetical protein
MLATSFLILGTSGLLVSPLDVAAVSFLVDDDDEDNLMGAAVGLAVSVFLARNSALPVLDELLRTSALMIFVAGRDGGLASVSLALLLPPE